MIKSVSPNVAENKDIKYFNPDELLLEKPLVLNTILNIVKAISDKHFHKEAEYESFDRYQVLSFMSTEFGCVNIYLQPLSPATEVLTGDSITIGKNFVGGKDSIGICRFTATDNFYNELHFKSEIHLAVYLFTRGYIDLDFFGGVRYLDW